MTREEFGRLLAGGRSGDLLTALHDSNLPNTGALCFHKKKAAGIFAGRFQSKT